MSTPLADASAIEQREQIIERLERLALVASRSLFVHDRNLFFNALADAGRFNRAYPDHAIPAMVDGKVPRPEFGP